MNSGHHSASAFSETLCCFHEYHRLSVFLLVTLSTAFGNKIRRRMEVNDSIVKGSWLAQQWKAALKRCIYALSQFVGRVHSADTLRGSLKHLRLATCNHNIQKLLTRAIQIPGMQHLPSFPCQEKSENRLEDEDACIQPRTPCGLGSSSHPHPGISITRHQFIPSVRTKSILRQRTKHSGRNVRYPITANTSCSCALSSFTNQVTIPS